MQNETQETENVESENIGNIITPEINSPVSAKEEKNETESSSRFKDGQELQLVRVRFPGNSRSFQFLQGSTNYKYGQKVLATSDRGTDVGYINSFPYYLKFKKTMLPLKSIIREANQDDIDQQMKNINQEKEAEIYCNQLIDDFKLNMNITHVQLLQFGKKMVFYFTAPNRVDFRELVKQLVGKLKIRIELRQITIRDRAACVGAVGSCGQITCCSSFLKSYGGASIKMAKNQNLALIPSKLNGVCGQIKCCIKFEDEVYTHKRKKIPRSGQMIQTKNGNKGKVLSLNIIEETFEMLCDSGHIRKYFSSEYDTTIKLPEGWTFPKEFNSILRETQNIIGRNEDDQKSSHKNKAQGETMFDRVLGLKQENKTKEKETLIDKPKENRNNQNRDRNNNKKPQEKNLKTKNIAKDNNVESTNTSNENTEKPKKKYYKKNKNFKKKVKNTTKNSKDS